MDDKPLTDENTLIMDSGAEISCIGKGTNTSVIHHSVIKKQKPNDTLQYASYDRDEIGETNIGNQRITTDDGNESNVYNNQDHEKEDMWEPTLSKPNEETNKEEVIIRDNNTSGLHRGWCIQEHTHQYSI
jgi:hypothetical protein